MKLLMKGTFRTEIGLSVAIAAVLTLAGLVSSGTHWQTSLLVGLVSILIGVLLTGLNAFDKRLDEIDERRIAVQSLQDLNKVPDLEEPLVRIVAAVASTQDKRSAFLKNQTTKEVEKFSREVARMADGAFVCSSNEEELDLVKGVLAATEETVRAVASRGVEWWLTPEGRVYFQAYGDETRRLDITRIFLIEKGALGCIREDVLAKHVDMGIRTYALDLQKVPQPLQGGLVLFDNALLHRAAPQREGSSNLKDVEFTDVPEEIQSAENDFANLLKLATTDHSALLFSGEPEEMGRGSANR